MGVRKDIMGKIKEYKQDPRGQYLKHLNKMLNLHTTGQMTKGEVFEHVKKWYNGKL